MRRPEVPRRPDAPPPFPKAAPSKRHALLYMRRHTHAILATIGADGGPQAALVGVAVTDEHDVLFDTLTATRKHENMLRDPRVAITYTGPEDQTLQLEGIAERVAPDDPSAAPLREAYYTVWPDGRARSRRAEIALWRVRPRWARFSDYAGVEPYIVEFHWDDVTLASG